MIQIISPEDLPSDMTASEAMVALWVDGANARAARVAPCLVSTETSVPTAGQMAEAKLVLLGAVIRWSQAGSGAVQSQTAGSFGMTVDTRQRTSGFNLWPSEIANLQAICKKGDDGKKAFSVDTVSRGHHHSPICSLYFGGTCSCGADVAGSALYESD